ncbi:hypothetical protein BH11MYX1_BH11MYX1_13770 [soil metagenome]
MKRLGSTLLLLASLGSVARADQDKPAVVTYEVGLAAATVRGVAQDYLVAPEGGELTGQMKFVMSDPSLGGEKLKFTDLGLFELAGRYSLTKQLELGGSIDVLPKQPSFTDEAVVQSGGGLVRLALDSKRAITVSGSGGHLLGHTGAWTRESVAFEYKKPISREFLAFDMQVGVDEVTLGAPHARGAYLTEASVSATALAHDPHGYFAAWLGIAYALPITSSGLDPTTAMPLDPQARLDFHAGTGVAIDKTWDLYADFAVIDRGDLTNPATRLPVLDGGFDQMQVMFGVTHHFHDQPKGQPLEVE